MEKNVKDLTFADLAKRARNEAEAFATYIIGDKPRYRSSREVRFYENQSLVVFISGSKQGKFKSFVDDSPTARGDLFDLWRYVRGGSPHDAVMGYKSFAGLVDADPNTKVVVNNGPSKEELERQEKEDIAKKMRTASWIWKNASPTDGREEGLKYLKGRGITIEPNPETVRFRTLSKADLEKMGITGKAVPDTPVTSIIFKATNNKGQISAVQQILTTNGVKANKNNPELENVKRTNGNLIGASVLLGEIGEDGKMIMAEGPETALSLHQATGIATMITLGTSNYTNVFIPKSVKTLIIATDMDKSGVGLGAALKAAQHWSRHGIENVGIAIPRTEDGDFNDILQAKGNDAVAQAVKKAFFPERTRNDEVVLVTPDSRVAFHAWMKTGVTTNVRIPPKNKITGKRVVNLDSAIEEHQKIAFLVGRKGFEFDREYLDKSRQDVRLIEVPDDSEAFLKHAKEPDYVQNIIQQADIYAPKGLGSKEPVAITLRRKDADALSEAGHMAIALRASEVEHLNLSFMNGRKAIIAPVGKGVSADDSLEDKLKEAGANTTRLTWQIFRPIQKGFEVVRSDIPQTYGAAEAVAEGWKGKAMADLLLISELNRAQIQHANEIREPIEPPAKKTASNQR